MLEVLRQDYVRTARAKGLQERVVLSRHALKNAMLPVVTVIGIEFAFLIGGLVVTETVFNLPGVARFLANKGEGFHHVCFEVPNLAETLLRLEIDGLELIDTAPRRGAEGPVAFIHPRSCHGVLVELIEAPGGPAWESLGF